jgi:hypothetical protein
MENIKDDKLITINQYLRLRKESIKLLKKLNKVGGTFLTFSNPNVKNNSPNESKRKKWLAKSRKNDRVKNRILIDRWMEKMRFTQLNYVEEELHNVSNGISLLIKQPLISEKRLMCQGVFNKLDYINNLLNSIKSTIKIDYY